MIESIPTPCLLCGENEGRVAEQITGTQLRELWRVSGHPLSDHALGPITKDFAIRLFECSSCGFRFYDPALAGSAEFYEELMTDKKYPVDSPEFLFALDLAGRFGARRVIDIGCGEGAFLDLARDKGFETYGVELNRVAAAVAEKRGHAMIHKMMEDISLDEVGGGVDLLTLFQVVEHVSSPADFVRDASRLVKPGGLVVVGVPSEKRMLGLLHHDPANWPPHHVSRWRISDFQKLAERTGLKLVEAKHDKLYGRAISWAWEYHNRMAPVMNQSQLPGGTWLPKTASLIYRYLGCKNYSPLHGLSIYAAFQKPA